MWCLAPKQDARFVACFVACMEDVLEVYARPYDPLRPVICLDEAAKQLLAQVRDVLPLKPGQPQRVDNEYERHGTCALFLLFEPLAAKRHVQVRQRRTALDYADVVKWMEVDVRRVVSRSRQDRAGAGQPQYPRPACALPSLCSQAFAPEEARRLCARIEWHFTPKQWHFTPKQWHFTPKHGSWLNMAEIELSILARQCLQERVSKSAWRTKTTSLTR